MSTTDLALTKGLPVNLDAERLVLGSVMIGPGRFPEIAGVLCSDDFAIEKHRRIFNRMADLNQRGEKIDHVTVANELRKHNQLESCDGLSYLVSLDDGLPTVGNLDAYVRIVQEKATLRRTIFAAQMLIDRCMNAEDEPGDLLTDAQRALGALQERTQQHGEWLTPGEVITRHPGGLNGFMDPPRGGLGIPTPWPRLTAKLAGLHPGDLVILAGRPSMGKSIVAMQMAYHAALNDCGAAFFSLEMNRESLIRRLIAAVARLDHERLRTGGLDREERERAAAAASRISNLPLFIDDTRARTTPAQVAALRKLRARNPVSIAFIDHLQLMKSTGRHENKHRELSEISHALKHLAQDLEIPVVLLSQLNRECEIDERQPQLTDLKETGTLEEDADVVVFVHRWERYRKFRGKPEHKGTADLIVAKQRNGPTGVLSMAFLSEQQRFEERATQGDL